MSDPPPFTNRSSSLGFVMYCQIVRDASYDRVIIKILIPYLAVFFSIAPSALRVKKSWACPRISSKAEQRKCPYPKIKNECYFDSTCDEGKKCCSDGCSLKCLQPVLERIPFLYKAGKAHRNFISFLSQSMSKIIIEKFWKHYIF